MKQKFGFSLLTIYAVYDLLFLVTDEVFSPIKEGYIKPAVERVLVLTAARKNIALAPFWGEAVICPSNLPEHMWDVAIILLIAIR